MNERDTPPGVTPLAEEVELVQSASRPNPIQGLQEALIYHRRGVYFRKCYASASQAGQILREAQFWLAHGVYASVAWWWEFGPHARFVIAWRRA